jgi:hypothetical protein
VPRLILLFVLSFILLFVFIFVYTPSSLMQLGNDLIFVYRKSVLFIIIFGAILMLFFSFAAIYFHLLRESVQMIQDYRSHKIIIYESRIVEKLYDPHSDTPYHVVLRHTIDKRQQFKMQKDHFDQCQIGAKVFVTLSYHAKILLSLRG